MANPLKNDCENANTHTLGGVGTFTKEVVFAGVRWVWARFTKENAYFLLRRMQVLVVSTLEQG